MQILTRYINTVGKLTKYHSPKALNFLEDYCKEEELIYNIALDESTNQKWAFGEMPKE